MDPILLRSIVRAALAVAASFLIAAALSLDAAGSSRGSRTPRPPAPPRVVDSARDQFDWSDAAIGAAGGLGLLLVVVGGQAAWVRRRDDADG